MVWPVQLSLLHNLQGHLKTHEKIFCISSHKWKHNTDINREPTTYVINNNMNMKYITMTNGVRKHNTKNRPLRLWYKRQHTLSLYLQYKLYLDWNQVWFCWQHARTAQIISIFCNAGIVFCICFESEMKICNIYNKQFVSVEFKLLWRFSFYISSGVMLCMLFSLICLSGYLAGVLVLKSFIISF